MYSITLYCINIYNCNGDGGCPWRNRKTTVSDLREPRYKLRNLGNGWTTIIQTIHPTVWKDVSIPRREHPETNWQKWERRWKDPNTDKPTV